MSRAPEDYGRDRRDSGIRRLGGERGRPIGERPAASSVVVPDPAVGRMARIVAGEHVLMVNPIDGSEVEPCPPAARPGPPVRSGPEAREHHRLAARPPAPVGHPLPQLPLYGRSEERDRLGRLLSRGRSVRVTGPSGAGRTSLLDAVAADCENLAPDGVVRLCGRNRSADDLLHELFAAVHDSAGVRPDRDRLLEAVRGIGAVVVVDDLEWGGAALDEFLAAVPDCALLMSATPDVPGPSAGAAVEELTLSGLGRPDSLDLLARAAQRPLDGEEAAWAADLWFESEGLPLRFVQAAAILRNRDAALPGRNPSETDEEFFAAFEPVAALTPLPPLSEAAAPAVLLAGRLSEPARSTLRLAVALGGECPGQEQLPALTGDSFADAAIGELLGCGLITAGGPRYRLAAGVLAQLEAAGYGTGAAERVRTVAAHGARWAADADVTPEQVAAEEHVVLAALAALATGGDPVHATAAVRLARHTAPLFAATLRWSAWETVLRHGQEAARHSGEVAEAAYFHHELGVLALCTGSMERARAELEASIGLRGALADRHGAVAGRRALALVEDHTQGFDHVTGTSTPPAGTRVAPAAAGATAVGLAACGLEAGTAAATAGAGGTPSAAERLAANRAAAIQSLRAARREGPQSLADGLPTPRAADETPDLFDTQPVQGGPAPVADEEMPEPLGQRPGVHRKREGQRRNAVVIGAGALLTAVIGTVVALGSSTGRDDGRGDRVRTEQPDVGGGDSGGGDVHGDDLWAESGEQRRRGGDAERQNPGGDGARSVSDDSGRAGEPDSRPRDETSRPGTPTSRPGSPSSKPTPPSGDPSGSPEPSGSSSSQPDDPTGSPSSSVSEIVDIPLD